MHEYHPHPLFLGLLILCHACAPPDGQGFGTNLEPSGIYSISSSGEPGSDSGPTDTTGSPTTSGSTGASPETSGASPTGTTTGVGDSTTTGAAAESMGFEEVGDASAQAASGASGESGDEPPCVGVSVAATPKLAPVDILALVDNSGSMSAENAEVQANLKQFADALAASTIDFQLFLVSRYPVDKSAPPKPQIGICVDPPLGNGGCPKSDSNGPFTHIDKFVNSHDSLDLVFTTADAWDPTMRPQARKHLLVVTDDDAVTDPAQAAVKAAAFHDGLQAQFPKIAGQYAFHAITGLAGVQCQDQYGQDMIERQGATYALLTKEIPNERAPGVLADLCLQDFDGVFADISASIAVGAELPCSLALPAPEVDQVFDPDKVNVHLILDGMAPIDLIRVKDVFACAEAQNGMGWYYDNSDAPTKILLCGAACQAGQSDEAELELELGCASIEPG